MKPSTIAAIRKTLRYEFARSGGLTKSEKKSAAARENGKRGGRPKKNTLANFVGWQRGTFSLDGFKALLSCGHCVTVSSRDARLSRIDCPECNEERGTK
jgi:hypothetical protein